MLNFVGWKNSLTQNWQMIFMITITWTWWLNREGTLFFSMEPGADKPSEAPKPPKALVAATPATMSGKWYKVMGWNPKYDCFDCQRNSFAKAGKTSASEVGAEIGASGMAVEVEYTMPRVRAGSAPENFHIAKLGRPTCDAKLAGWLRSGWLAEYQLGIGLK